MKTNNKLSKWCKNTLMMLPAVAALILVACNKEETPNPFAGGDNHVTSFVLTKGGINYVAAITAGTITVTTPANVSLSGATAEYALCENATINPDPAGITDWDNEQQFAITAYNGTKSTYLYTVEKSDLVRDGAVILKTQAEVDAFGQGGYTVLNGYLTIGAATGKDTITSLAPLATLKSVLDDITVNATYGGDELTAFENLETAGGLKVLSKKVRIVHFPKLTTVRLDMNFDQASAITMLDFPELTAIDRGLRIYYVDSLATLNFPKLQRVLESVTIEGRSNISGIPNLQAVEFPELTGVGTFTLTNLTNLRRVNLNSLETAGGISLPCALFTEMNFPALTTVSGNLTLSGSTLTTNLQLRALATVEGTLSLTLPNLPSLDLPALEKVGTFSAVDIPLITAYDVRGKEIGTLSFGENTLMNTTGITVTGDETFAGRLVCTFPNLPQAPASAPAFPVTVQGIKKVGGLELIGLASGFRVQVTDLDLSWLEEVEGLLNISYWNMVKRIDLSNLTKVGGLQIKGMLNLQDTLKLPELTAITGGDFLFTVSSSSFTALKLPKLESIVGNLSITGFTAASILSTISFPALETITGKLEISTQTVVTKNANFRDLSGFSTLTSAAGVTIRDFTQLSDFSPLGKVVCSLPSASAWSIVRCGGTSANYSYQTMIDTYCNND